MENQGSVAKEENEYAAAENLNKDAREGTRSGEISKTNRFF